MFSFRLLRSFLEFPPPLQPRIFLQGQAERGGSSDLGVWLFLVGCWTQGKSLCVPWLTLGKKLLSVADKGIKSKMFLREGISWELLVPYFVPIHNSTCLSLCTVLHLTILRSTKKWTVYPGSQLKVPRYSTGSLQQTGLWWRDKHFKLSIGVPRWRCE